MHGTTFGGDGAAVEERLGSGAGRVSGKLHELGGRSQDRRTEVSLDSEQWQEQYGLRQVCTYIHKYAHH